MVSGGSHVTARSVATAGDIVAHFLRGHRSGLTGIIITIDTVDLGNSMYRSNARERGERISLANDAKRTAEGMGLGWEIVRRHTKLEWQHLQIWLDAVQEVGGDISHRLVMATRPRWVYIDGEDISDSPNVIWWAAKGNPINIGGGPIYHDVFTSSWCTELTFGIGDRSYEGLIPVYQIFLGDWRREETEDVLRSIFLFYRDADVIPPVGVPFHHIGFATGEEFDWHMGMLAMDFDDHPEIRARLIWDAIQEVGPDLTYQFYHLLGPFNNKSSRFQLTFDDLKRRWYPNGKKVRILADKLVSSR